MLVRQLRLLNSASVLVGAGLLAYAGCSSSATSPVEVTHPTMIEVSPDNFLGDVPCAQGGPGLKRFVATLLDTNAGGTSSETGTGSAGEEADAGDNGPNEFQLPSSKPTSCLTAVGFGFVVPGRHYRVEIDGFDTDELTPRALGAREMMTTAPGPNLQRALVEPAWLARCERAIAVDRTVVRADHCTPFVSKAPDANGSVSIDVAPLLSGLPCGSAAGEVDHLTVSLIGAPEAEPRVQTVACRGTSRVIFDDLPKNLLVSVNVTAFSAESTTALAGATCAARTVAGTTVAAQCSALNRVGTLRVDLPAALGLLGVSCDKAEVSQLQLTTPGDAKAKIIVPPACRQPFDQGFAPGDAALTLTVLGTAPAGDAGAGAELGSLTCHASVAPGQLVTAQCDLNTSE